MQHSQSDINFSKLALAFLATAHEQGMELTTTQTERLIFGLAQLPHRYETTDDFNLIRGAELLAINLKKRVQS